MLEILKGSDGYRVADTRYYDYESGDSIENLALYYHGGDEVGLVEAIQGLGNEVKFYDCTHGKYVSERKYRRHLKNYNSDRLLIVPTVTFKTEEKAREVLAILTLQEEKLFMKEKEEPQKEAEPAAQAEANWLGVASISGDIPNYAETESVLEDMTDWLRHWSVLQFEKLLDEMGLELKDGVVREQQKKAIWRYSINSGECGGVVAACSEAEAEQKVRNRYTGRMDRIDSLLVWPYSHDEYFDPEHPDVFDCYGM